MKVCNVKKMCLKVLLKSVGTVLQWPHLHAHAPQVQTLATPLHQKCISGSAGRSIHCIMARWLQCLVHTDDQGGPCLRLLSPKNIVAVFGDWLVASMDEALVLANSTESTRTVLARVSFESMMFPGGWQVVFSSDHQCFFLLCPVESS